MLRREHAVLLRGVELQPRLVEHLSPLLPRLEHHAMPPRSQRQAERNPGKRVARIPERGDQNPQLTHAKSLPESSRGAGNQPPRRYTSKREKPPRAPHLRLAR